MIYINDNEVEYSLAVRGSEFDKRGNSTGLGGYGIIVENDNEVFFISAKSDVISISSNTNVDEFINVEKHIIDKVEKLRDSIKISSEMKSVECGAGQEDDFVEFYSGLSKVKINAVCLLNKIYNDKIWNDKYESIVRYGLLKTKGLVAKRKLVCYAQSIFFANLETFGLIVDENKKSYNVFNGYIIDKKFIDEEIRFRLWVVPDDINDYSLIENNGYSKLASDASEIVWIGGVSKTSSFDKNDTRFGYYNTKHENPMVSYGYESENIIFSDNAIIEKTDVFVKQRNISRISLSHSCGGKASSLISSIIAESTELSDSIDKISHEIDDGFYEKSAIAAIRSKENKVNVFKDTYRNLLHTLIDTSVENKEKAYTYKRAADIISNDGIIPSMTTVSNSIFANNINVSSESIIISYNPVVDKFVFSEVSESSVYKKENGFLYYVDGLRYGSYIDDDGVGHFVWGGVDKEFRVEKFKMSNVFIEEVNEVQSPNTKFASAKREYCGINLYDDLFANGRYAFSIIIDKKDFDDIIRIAYGEVDGQYSLGIPNGFLDIEWSSICF